MGLGLGWRNAAEVVPVAHEIGDILLGISTAYFLVFLALYLRKLVARPRVLFEDMDSPASRAGVAAAAMTMMLLAAALLPLGVSVPPVWWTGVILQIGASAVVCWAIWNDPPERRRFTPFQYLTFVGPVIGPIAGIPLGFETESLALILAALIAYLIITAGYGRSLLRALPPMGLRPTLVIFLAPNCLFAIGFGLLGYEPGFQVFYWIANIVALTLVLLSPWLLAGGWSPAWAGLTFPSAAFLQVQVLAVVKGGGMMALTGVYAGLIVATPLVLVIAYRFTMLYVTGALAEQTGAAEV